MRSRNSSVLACCSLICSWQSVQGGLGEICFGKMRRRMAKGLRSIAGWFDPTKEEPKKGRRRTKGKTEKKEVPAVAVPEAEERNHPTVKVEMKGKEKDEVKEKAKGKNMEKPPQKRPETNSLVVTKSYGTRQQPPINATGSGAIAGKEMPLLLLTETRK